MEKVILKADLRESSGKRAAKDLRRKSMIPANVYKAGKEATSLQVSADDLAEVLSTKAGENVIITLKVSSPDAKPKERTVLIKEIQRDPIKDGILHVDFGEISLTEALKVNVPLATNGEPVGVKADGGILEHVIWELHVECLPTAIPEKIEIDVANMKIGDSVFIKDIKVPDGVKVLNDPELIAVIVKHPKVEVPKEEIPGAEAATEPELIRKKKEEEAPESGEANPKETAKEAPKEGKKE